MNDRFKFRYFNKYANKMVKPENWQNVDGIYECIKQQVCFDEDIAPLPYDHIGNDLVFMQCTGLKDKNGKLIYEGDIVVSTSPRRLSDRPHEVKLYKTTYGHYGYLYIEAEREPLVIGNIYENPELIERI